MYTILYEFDCIHCYGHIFHNGHIAFHLLCPLFYLANVIMP